MKITYYTTVMEVMIKNKRSFSFMWRLHHSWSICMVLLECWQA